MDLRFNRSPQLAEVQPADVLPDPASGGAELQGQSVMNWIRNSRPVQFAAEVAVGLSLTGGALALNAEPVSAEGNIPARVNMPEASDSAAGFMKPTAIMAAISKATRTIGRQTGFTQIRPKEAAIAEHKVFILGGKESCRPGHDNDPLLYLLKYTHSKITVGACEKGKPIRTRHNVPPYPDYTGPMNNISAKVEAANGLHAETGDTKSIEVTMGGGSLKFECDPTEGDTIRSLEINSEGAVIANTKCD